MSWNVYIDAMERGEGDADVIKAINALTATQVGAPQETVDSQLAQAKTAAYELLKGVKTAKVRVSLGGHVHTGQDAPDAINASVNGQS